jgi:hypothetical protein
MTLDWKQRDLVIRATLFSISISASASSLSDVDISHGGQTKFGAKCFVTCKPSIEHYSGILFNPTQKPGRDARLGASMFRLYQAASQA